MRRPRCGRGTGRSPRLPLRGEHRTFGRRVFAPAMSLVSLCRCTVSGEFRHRQLQRNIMTDESTRQGAIVTGASRGIGAAVAKQLARAGYHVVVN